MKSRLSEVIEQFVISEASFLFVNTDFEDDFFLEKNENMFDAKKRESYGAYYPFLDYIKKSSENKNETEINNLIEKARVYYFQRSTFRSFLMGRESIRDEELNPEECEYEKKELYNGIINLISEISYEENLVFMIKNANFLDYSAIEFLEWIISEKYKIKFSIVLFFNDNILNKRDDISEKWGELLEKAEENSLILNMVNEKRYGINDNNSEIIYKDSYSFSQLIRMADEYYNFFAFNEAYTFLEYIKNKEYSVKLTKKEKIAQYKILGNISYCKKESDLAISSYNTFLDEAESENEKKEMCEAYRKLAETHFMKQNFELADKYIENSIRIATEIADELELLKSYQTKIILKNSLDTNELKNWRNLFQKIENLAKKYKMYNCLCRIYGIGVASYGFYEKTTERVEVCKNAILLTMSYGNKTRLASLYHNMGMIYMEGSDIDTAFKYYKKSEKLKLKVGIKNEIARVYNGIGYEYMLIEEFKNAVLNYAKAFDYLKNEKDYNDIILTIFNISYTYFLTFNYRECSDYLEKIVVIMKILGLKKIPFHSMGTINAMLSISFIEQGKYMKAHEFYNKAEMSFDKENCEDSVFKNIMEALFFSAEKNYKLALEKMETLNSHEIAAIPSILYIKYLYLKYKIVKISNNDVVLHSLKDEALNLCKKKNFYVYEKLFITGEKNIEEFWEFKIRKIEIESMIEMAKKDVMLNKLYKKRAEEKLIMGIQQILLKAGATQFEIIRDSMNILKSGFLGDVADIIKITGNTWSSVCGFADEHIELINKIINENKQSNEIIINGLDEKKYSGKNRINAVMITTLKLGNGINGYLFLAAKNKNTFFSYEDLKVTAIISQYISMAVANRELAEKLEQKNHSLMNTIEKMNSIESLVSIMHREKDYEKAIKYILEIIISENVMNASRGFYLEYIKKERAFLLISDVDRNKGVKFGNNSNKMVGENFITNSILIDSMENNKIRDGYSSESILGNNFAVFDYSVLPVSSQRENIGIIVIEKAENTGREFFNKDILNIFTTNLAVYLENVKYSKELIKTENLRTIVDFSKAIVHQLRTPLSSIREFAKIEKKRRVEDLKSLYHMDMIISGANSVDEMVRELIEFVNNEDKKKSWVDIGKIVDKAVHDLNYEIEFEKINIEKHVEDSTEIYFNPKQLKKVIHELIKNSIEASKEEGSIVKIFARNIGKDCELKICDSGVGMNREQLKKINEPLYSSKIQGTGLGFPIVISILKKAGAKIEVKSEENQGTEIKILFKHLESSDEFINF